MGGESVCRVFGEPPVSSAQSTKIMGILNVTPDSFSDGGRFNSVDAALKQAHIMAEDGCDIFDVGGESTRPGHEPVSSQEEMDRVLPVIEALAAGFAIPISIDTTKSDVAAEAIKAGATIINDIWGLQGDPKMASIAAKTGVQVVAMHNRDSKDETLDILADFDRFFSRTFEIADEAGLPRDKLVVDPGIGFGKTLNQNLRAIAHLDHMAKFGCPILLGLSRISFLGFVTGAEVDNRLTGTIVADLIGVQKGADIIRVHDVKPHREMLTLMAALESA